MTEEQIRQTIMASPFAAHVEAFMAHGQPGLRLHAERVSFDELALGASRLGGLPDLPPGMSWPYDNKNRPLELVAQINLTDAASCFHLPDLPASGWLAFFYDTENQPGGYWPKDEWSGRRVLFFEGDAGELVRMESPPRPPPKRGFIGRLLFGPPKPHLYYQPCAVRFEQDFRLANTEENPALDNVYEPMLAYEELMDSLGYWRDDIQHWLRGHEDPVQGPMRREAEEMARKSGLIEATDTDPEGCKWDWELLLQIDSDKPGPGWMWGDAGRVYFWIRRQDLAARDFSKVWCVLQCT